MIYPREPHPVFCSVIKQIRAYQWRAVYHILAQTTAEYTETYCKDIQKSNLSEWKRTQNHGWYFRLTDAMTCCDGDPPANVPAIMQNSHQPTEHITARYPSVMNITNFVIPSVPVGRPVFVKTLVAFTVYIRIQRRCYPWNAIDKMPQVLYTFII